MALKKDNIATPAPAAVAEAPVATDVAAATPAVASTANKEERKAEAKRFRAEGLALAKQEDEAGVVKGEARDKVKFLTALGNPASPATYTKGGEKDLPTIDIIGYELEALADIMVPVVDRTGIPKKNVMGFNSYQDVPVKKGQKFTLSIAELFLMIQRVEYNGMFTGGGDPVEVGCVISKSQGSKYAPRVLLKRPIGADVSVKENVKPIAVRKEGTDQNSNSLKNFDVLPEYAEKFGYIFEEVVSTGRKSGGAKKREAGENAAEIAAALRAYMQKNQAM